MHPLIIEQLEDRLVASATSFVTSLYQNVLMRNPETTGLNFWVTQIQNGMSNATVATGFWQSVEHRTLEINDYYQTLLGRSPTVAESNFWVKVMTSGKMGELDVQANFVLSNEFVADHDTPENYIAALYAAFLGRAPSIDEEVSWESVLAANGAPTVVVGIERSAEAYTRIVDNYYTTYLKRNPDPAGLAFWLNQIQTGQESVGLVAELILGSGEYANGH
jgi:hypothetical protein